MPGVLPGTTDDDSSAGNVLAHEGTLESNFWHAPCWEVLNTIDRDSSLAHDPIAA